MISYRPNLLYTFDMNITVKKNCWHTSYGTAATNIVLKLIQLKCTEILLRNLFALSFSLLPLCLTTLQLTEAVGTHLSPHIPGSNAASFSSSSQFNSLCLSSLSKMFLPITELKSGPRWTLSKKQNYSTLK